MKDKKVLCVSNSYEQKYYLSDEFEGLPENIKNEIKIMSVIYTEDVGGILSLVYDNEGNLEFEVMCDEGDLLFDEIGSVLKIKQLREEKAELLEALEMYYKVFFLHMDCAGV